MFISNVVHSSDATNSIKVYDGKIDNPQVYKVVHASRTSKASQVLVRKFILVKIIACRRVYHIDCGRHGQAMILFLCLGRSIETLSNH